MHVSESDLRREADERTFDSSDRMPQERWKDKKYRDDQGFTSLIMMPIIPELRRFSWLGGDEWPVEARLL